VLRESRAHGAVRVTSLGAAGPAAPTYIPDPGRLPIDPQSEFGGHPPGRLGRPLVAEIDAYLNFFALAHERESER